MHVASSMAYFYPQLVYASQQSMQDNKWVFCTKSSIPLQIFHHSCNCSYLGYICSHMRPPPTGTYQLRECRRFDLLRCAPKTGVPDMSLCYSHTPPHPCQQKMYIHYIPELPPLAKFPEYIIYCTHCTTKSVQKRNWSIYASQRAMHV